MVTRWYGGGIGGSESGSEVLLMVVLDDNRVLTGKLPVPFFNQLCQIFLSITHQSTTPHITLVHQPRVS